MQILLANAKIMYAEAARQPLSEPLFQATAHALAAEMSALTIEELARELDCSTALAAENWQRYQHFFCTPKLPALLAYNGQAYKHLKAHTLSMDALNFAQHHLWITCFLYGLLRPMDGIVPYRMEHNVHLPITGGQPIHRFWKNSRLTDELISRVKADDGILVHLSTEEYEHLFDWKRVKQEVRVIQPLFYVQKNGRMKVQAVWAKSCRGALTRFLLEQRITCPEEMNAFSYEGFEYQPQLGEPDFPHFVRNI